MTTRARLALADCEHALTDYEAGANTPFQWTRWVAMITLLRAVGHVLHKVDRPAADVATQRRIDAAWRQLNATKLNPPIFHDFIDSERGNVVKQYDPSARVNVTIRLGGVSTSGGRPRRDHRRTSSSCGKLPFEGRDPRDLCREAIAFWRTYLDAIDDPRNEGGEQRLIAAIYARVSTQDQHPEYQLLELLQAHLYRRRLHLDAEHGHDPVRLRRVPRSSGMALILPRHPCALAKMLRNGWRSLRHS